LSLHLECARLSLLEIFLGSDGSPSPPAAENNKNPSRGSEEINETREKLTLREALWR